MTRVQLPTVCALDCPDTCALQVTVEGGRVIQVAGDSSHPVTRGFACVKTVRYPERQNHPERLAVPQLRDGPKGSGRFRPTTWDEAIQVIAERSRALIELYGGESILPYSYAGTMGLIERDHPLAFFRAIGASELDWTICAATGGTGWELAYGPNKVGTAPEDFAHSGLIVLWGANVVRSNSHLVPWIKAAQRRGTQVWHIDPYRNETARLSDHHLAVRVGTDAALALALGNEILRRGAEDRDYLDQHASGLDAYRASCAPWSLDRAAAFCGIPLDQLRMLADAIIATPNPCFRLGYGMTRNEGGGNATLAVALLPALRGAWKHRGGGGLLSTSGAFELNACHNQGRHLKRPNVRHINQNQLGSALLEADPPIRGLFVFNSNPAVVAPDSSRVRRGLQRADLFTVVLEHFQTDTADYADVLLPATTFLEHPDLYTAYGHYFLQWAEPVAEPYGQSRPNSWVFAQLAQHLDLHDPWLHASTETLAKDLIQSNHPHLKGITWERLQTERSVRLALPELYLPYADGSHHQDRKIHFGSPAPQQIEFVVSTNSNYPLRLISPPGSHTVNSTMGNVDSLLRLAGGEPKILVHPDDAAVAGVEHGQKAVVTSSQGTIVRRVEITEDTRAGVVIAVGLWWPKRSPDGKGLNELTSDQLTDFGGGSCFGNAVVRLEPITCERPT